VKAYETLTDEAKFENYRLYGNPDGSLVVRAVEIALPSFLFDEQYKTLVISAFFICFICGPIIVVYSQ
jgi:preprotein translocase subunit Sec63